MRVGHVGSVSEETGRLPLKTAELKEVIWGKSVSGNSLKYGQDAKGD